MKVAEKLFWKNEMKYEHRAKIRLELVLFLSLVFFPLLLHGQTPTLGIPIAIKIILDRNYPGWKMGAISNEVDKFFKESKFKFVPNLVCGDFDGDGRDDYGIKINFKGKWYAIAFLRRGGDYKQYVLRAGNVPDLDVYLFLYEKGGKGFNIETGKYFIFKNDSVGIGFYEKASIAYIYRNSNFAEVFTSD